MNRQPVAARRGRTSDRIAALVILAGSVLYLLQARTFRPFLRTEPLGPATFPLAVGVMMFVLAAILLISTFRPSPQEGAAAEGAVAGAPAEDRPRGARVYGRPAALWLLLAGYVVAFEWVGFIIGTALFLTLALLLLGQRRWWQAVAVALLFTAGLWYGFGALDVRLPGGELFR